MAGDQGRPGEQGPKGPPGEKGDTVRIIINCQQWCIIIHLILFDRV